MHLSTSGSTRARAVGRCPGGQLVPRLPELVDRVPSFIEAATAKVAGIEEEQLLSDDLVALLEAAFVDAFPYVPRSRPG